MNDKAFWKIVIIACDDGQNVKQYDAMEHDILTQERHKKIKYIIYRYKSSVKQAEIRKVRYVSRKRKYFISKEIRASVDIYNPCELKCFFEKYLTPGSPDARHMVIT